MSEVTAYLYNCTPVKPGVNITWSLINAQQELAQELYNRKMPEGQFPVSGRIYANKEDAEQARAKAGVDFVVYEIKFDLKPGTTMGSYEDPNHPGVMLLEIPKDSKPKFVGVFNGHGAYQIKMDEQGKYKIAPVNQIPLPEQEQVTAAHKESAGVAEVGLFKRPPKVHHVPSILERAQAAQSSKDKAEPPRSGPAPAA